MATRKTRATRKRRKKILRDLTAQDSLEILTSLLVDQHEILGFKNHRKHNLKENTFRFTLDLISLEFLITLMEHELVKNVYFNPSVPPPGGSLDSISMRFKVYVEYNQKEELENAINKNSAK